MKDEYPENVTFNFDDDNLDAWGETPFYIFEDDSNFYFMPREDGDIDVNDVYAASAKASWLSKIARKGSKGGSNIFGGLLGGGGSNLLNAGKKLDVSKLSNIRSGLGASMPSFQKMPNKLQKSLGNSFSNLGKFGKKSIDDVAEGGPDFAKRVTKNSESVAKGAKKICKTRTCAAVESIGKLGKKHSGTLIVGAGVGTFLAINHSNKSAMEQQCIALCVPKDWDKLRSDLDDGTLTSAPTAANNCNTDSSNTNPICFRNLATLQSDPEFFKPESQMSIFPADWTEAEQPFCTLKEYTDKPPTKDSGGDCEDMCATRCGIIHRSAAEAVGDTFDFTTEALGELMNGMSHCLPGGDFSQCPLNEFRQYFIYGIIGIVVFTVLIPILKMLLLGGGNKYYPPPQYAPAQYPLP
tara:strand:+ start:7324 stop:8550 length:1227 start_codon:yes stop_codon:yes gene_type:complete